MNILITGASGFIGSFLCEEAHKRHYNVFAGMREKSSRKWLQGEWLNFVTLDLSDTAKLADQLERYKQKYGKWDVIVHAGGATKCLHKEDFKKHNFECTRNFVETLISQDMFPEHFIYVSSLSVQGAIREEMVEPHPLDIMEGIERNEDFIDKYTVKQSVYEPILGSDTPQPNTAYGESKVLSEQYLAQKKVDMDAEGRQFNYTIFRPTGVYGPREKDYFVMAQSIKQHSDFAVGYKPQEITFIYVRDLVDAILASIDKPVSYGKTYSVADGFVYNSRAFSDLLQKELGTRFVLHIKAPIWFLKIVCAVSESISKITGKPGTLNNDKFMILKQRNWQCDITPLKEDLGFIPQWNLERGVKETIAWYKDNKWL